MIFNGGAIYVFYGSILDMEDCTFTNNSAGSSYTGGAIYGVYTEINSGAENKGAAIRILGDLKINGEPVNANSNNLFLGQGGIVLDITGKLTNEDPIPVSVEDNPTDTDVRVFTAGLADNGTYKDFYSVNGDYTVVPTDDYFVKTNTVYKTNEVIRW